MRDSVIALARELGIEVRVEALSRDALQVADEVYTFEELRELVERQKARTSRIPEPDAVRRARLPRPLRGRPGTSAWGIVSMGYQPDLTRPWFQTMEAFAREAKLDQVFAKSVFWVVTRTNDCFY